LFVKEEKTKRKDPSTEVTRKNQEQKLKEGFPEKQFEISEST